MDEQASEWREQMLDAPIRSCGRLDMATYMPGEVTVGRVTSDRVRYVYFENGTEVICLGQFADYVAFQAADYAALRAELEEVRDAAGRYLQVAFSRRMKINALFDERNTLTAKLRDAEAARERDDWQRAAQEWQRAAHTAGDYRNAERARAERAEALLEKIRETVDNSRGVDGWHLNGDVATWGEFDWYEELQASPAPESPRVDDSGGISQSSCDPESPPGAHDFMRLRINAQHPPQPGPAEGGAS